MDIVRIVHIVLVTTDHVGGCKRFRHVMSAWRPQCRCLSTDVASNAILHSNRLHVVRLQPRSSVDEVYVNSLNLLLWNVDNQSIERHLLCIDHTRRVRRGAVSQHLEDVQRRGGGIHQRSDKLRPPSFHVISFCPEESILVWPSSMEYTEIDVIVKVD